MLQVRCPWCGEREETEFSCHGEACVPRPENPDALDDRAWGEYLFFKENVKGLTWERWEHAFGCRRWFVALRDNVSDTFLGFAKPNEPLPSVPKGYRQARSCVSIPLPRSAKGWAGDKKTVAPSTSRTDKQPHKKQL